MDLTTDRSIRGWAAAVAVTVAVALAAGCSSSSETVAADGTVASRAGTTELTAPGATTGSTGTTTVEATTADEAPVPAPTGAETTAVRPSGPETTVPEPDEPLPEVPVTPATIPAAGGDPALVDCGTLYRAAGWPTTFVMSREAFTCLADAFAAGTPARLVDREQTDGEGGAPLVTTYDVLGPGQLRVTEDATRAADRPQVVTVSMCTGVVAEFQHLAVSGCTVVAD